MPNRILRDWTDSDRVNALSAEAERFFTRLIMKADDFGRYFADGPRLKAYLFPLISSISETDCLRWLAECEAAGLVHRYEVAGKKYLEVVRFGQRLRNMRNTHPAPPGKAGEYGHPPQLAASRGESPPESESESESETESETNRIGNESERGACELPEGASIKIQDNVLDDLTSSDPEVTPARTGGVELSPEVKAASEPETNRMRNGIRDVNGNETGVRASVARLLEEGLNTAYQRNQDSVWSYAEQTQLAEIARRPQALSELQLLLGYRRRLGGGDRRFFPNSVGSLLAKWPDVLDRARAARPEPIRSQPPPALRGPKLTDDQRLRLAGVLAQVKVNL